MAVADSKDAEFAYAIKILLYKSTSRFRCVCSRQGELRVLDL